MTVIKYTKAVKHFMLKSVWRSVKKSQIQALLLIVSYICINKRCHRAAGTCLCPQTPVCARRHLFVPADTCLWGLTSTSTLLFSQAIKYVKETPSLKTAIILAQLWFRCMLGSLLFLRALSVLLFLRAHYLYSFSCGLTICIPFPAGSLFLFLCKRILRRLRPSSDKFNFGKLPTQENLSP